MMARNEETQSLREHLQMVDDFAQSSDLGKETIEDRIVADEEFKWLTPYDKGTALYLLDFLNGDDYEPKKKIVLGLFYKYDEYHFNTQSWPPKEHENHEYLKEIVELVNTFQHNKLWMMKTSDNDRNMQLYFKSIRETFCKIQKHGCETERIGFLG